MTSKSENWPLRNRVRQIGAPRLKQFVGNRLCDRYVGTIIGKLYREQIPSGPFSIRTDAPTVSPRTKAMIFWGFYEGAEIRMVHKHLRSDLDLLEIGSSLGVVSSHAMSRLADDRKVVCVEANPNLQGVLRSNCTKNHPNRDVTIFNQAVDYVNAPGKTEIFLADNTAGSRLDRFATDASDDASRVSIDATTIQRLVAAAGLRDFALISDIEGAEAGFIFADADELAGCRQILIELHDTEFEGRSLRWQDLLKELETRHGFRAVDGYGPVQVLER